MVSAESISHQGYRRLLAQAREYVLENSAEPLTVLDLCQQLYVSRRTLQNAFHAILGIGPNAWLKRIRLNAVRRELISPWSERETVKEAAMQWGFWHLGQFATDYQQLFAEKPSMTLHHRLRQQAAVALVADTLRAHHRLRLFQHRPHRQQQIIPQHLAHHRLMKGIRMLAEGGQRLLHKPPQRGLMRLPNCQR